MPTVMVTFVLATFVHIRNIVKTPTQPQLNLTVGFDTKITLHHHHPPPTPTHHTNSMLAILNSYWPNLDQTLKVGSWDHLEQISTVKMIFVTFVQATFVLVAIAHIRNILAVTDPILNQFFYSNFCRL